MKNSIQKTALMAVMSVCVVLGAALLFQKVFSQVNSQKPTSNAVVLPAIPVKGCRGGTAKLYDECGLQIPIFDEAMKLAQAEEKILLVSYGAEWCIWCHVFDAYVQGQHSAFAHTYSDSSDEERYTATLYERPASDPSAAAADLATFFEETFVLVHIENRYSEDGIAVLRQSEANSEFEGGLPFIFTVDQAGKFAATLDYKKAEIRRDTNDWFRGYDRNELRLELSRMAAIASQ